MLLIPFYIISSNIYIYIYIYRISVTEISIPLSILLPTPSPPHPSSTQVVATLLFCRAVFMTDYGPLYDPAIKAESRGGVAVVSSARRTLMRRFLGNYLAAYLIQ